MYPQGLRLTVVLVALLALLRCGGTSPESAPVAETAAEPAPCASVDLEGDTVSDDMRALELHIRDCHLGNANACYRMGVFYDRGRGTVTNHARAATAYEQACNGGVAMACTDLGFLYERGRGVIADPKRAAELFLRGCEGGPCSAPNLRGCVNLGDAYRDGIGVAQDYTRAAQIFRQTCDSPLRNEEDARIRACVLFAALQFTGEGTPEDEASAFKISLEGCEQGDAFGCFNVAAIHAHREEYEQAAKFYQKSCDGKDGEACYELGVLYDEAKGVPFDAIRATSLYKLACARGFEKACK